MGRRADQIAEVKASLDAVVAAVNATADEAAQRQAGILRAISALDGKVADLAEAVGVVMAARMAKGEDAADLSEVLAELRAIRALMTPTEPLAAVDAPVPEPPGSPEAAGVKEKPRRDGKRM